ncbi:MAG: hypothetical protein KTV68_03595 [Acidimicrobiia bacterium]|nr:hypothetical protein [Acidimicrobiia bacterium]MCY4435225.1 hypothetical protein [bacterium]
MRAEFARSLSDSELKAAVAEVERRARQRRLETWSELRALDANAQALVQLQDQLDGARAYRAELIEKALETGCGRAAVADAARITVRRLDAIRSNSPKPAD